MPYEETRIFILTNALHSENAKWGFVSCHAEPQFVVVNHLHMFLMTHQLTVSCEDRDVKKQSFTRILSERILNRIF